MVFRESIVSMLMLFVFVSIIIGVLCLMGCTHGRTYELYVHDAARQLFVRDLINKDVLTYEQADGLICQKPEDVKKSFKAKSRGL